MTRPRFRLLLVLGLLFGLIPITAAPAAATTGDLVISGVVDGPLIGGIPKVIELYVVNAIPDLSIYGVGSANNGGGSDGEEFTFPADSAAAGDFIYLATEAVGFTTFFGFAPDYTASAASINGDDAIELFKNGSVADVFGDINVDGTGQPWEHLDGWAYRVDETGVDGSTFVLANWTFSGPNALDGESTNATAAVPFPIGTYTGTSAGPTVVINEVDADQTGTDSAEFVELFDGGAGNTDLSGLVVVLFNGSDDASYLSFDLDGFSTGGDGYFVLCGDAGNVANCDLDVSPNTNLVQNGADAVALFAGDAADFPNDTPVTTEGLIDAIVYDTYDGDDAGLLVLLNAGQPQVNEGGGGDKNNHSNQRCPNGSGGLRNTDAYEQWAPTAGEENLCEAPPEELFIHEVQGPGSTTPFPGVTVIVEGVVVGDFQDTDISGFFLQEEDADVDGDPATSEGILVYEGSSAVPVNMGDTVKVTGTAVEYYDVTEINNVTSVEVTGSGALATPVALSYPVSETNNYETIEGMGVVIAQPMVITEYFNFDRYGEVSLGTERLQQPTAIYEPGSVEAADLADLNARSRITLDDGWTASNVDPARHPNGDVFDLTNTFRGGDLVANVVGVVHDSFGYRIHPTAGAEYTAANPRPANPDGVDGDVTVASFNVLNYFTTLDNAGPICGPGEDQGCRGADNAGEFTRQRDKIISAIAGIDADVVGLLEIENYKAGGVDMPLADLVGGINAVVGTGTYALVETGPIGDDAIKVAMIYKPATVSLNGAFAILDSSVDPGFNDEKNRPALAQTFTENVTGESVTVAVNHLKSKGSNCDSIGDPDLGDGAGNCNLTRTSAAEALVDWLAADATGSGEDDVLIIGDLNSYDKEDPIDALIAGGYSDLVADFGGEDAYSYVYSAQWGYLDYALANEALRPWITGTTIWHINADEPDILDYDTSYKKSAQDALYEPNAFRSSDHDPVIVGLNLANPQGDKEAVVADLEALLTTDDAKTDRQISKAVDSIEASLNDGWWTSDQTITSKKVFDNERNAVVQLELVVAAGGPEAVVAQDAIDVLVNADRQLAQIELIAAIARDGKANKIADAQMAMAYAADLTMDGLYNEAVNAYKTAWDAASKA